MTTPEQSSPEIAVPQVNRRRWAWHLILLVTYVLLIGAAGIDAAPASKPALPGNAMVLLWVVAVELALFAIVFLVACRVSGVSREELLLPWRGGAWPVLRGIGYSLALRLLIAIVVIALVVFYLAITGAGPQSVEKFQPRVDALVDTKAMASNPVYLWLNLTLISFVVAGLREELWRAGVLAAMRVLWPQRFASLAGGIAAAAIIAVIFGLAHAPQGLMGMIMTGVLGFGLGVIMVVHRTIWDAVIAHGVFDATSFALIALLAAHEPKFL